MQKVLKIISSSLLLCLMTVSLISAQDKKSEQKIKIVIDDGSGTKVVIDTLIKDGQKTDSLKLKNGKVIFIGHPGEENVQVKSDGAEHIYVTVTSDGKDAKKEVKTITVINSDSDTLKESTEGDNVLVYSDSKNPDKKSNVHYRVVTRNSGSGESLHEKKVYVIEGKDPINDNRETYEVTVSDDEKGSSEEKTKYIIAKDGVVVTVESNDEAKAKELIKEIENKLGVKDEGSDKKETVNVEAHKKAMK